MISRVPEKVVHLRAPFVAPKMLGAGDDALSADRPAFLSNRRPVTFDKAPCRRLCGRVCEKPAHRLPDVLPAHRIAEDSRQDIGRDAPIGKVPEGLTVA